MRAFFTALIIAPFFVAVGHAATLRVGPSRTYKTINDVTHLVKPGDVVEVDGDATYPGMITWRVNATAAAPITVRGITINGKRPLIAGAKNTAGGSAVRFWGHNYFFENFEVTGGGETTIARGLNIVAHKVTIRDCIVHDVPAQGIQASDDAGSVTLERVEVYRCGAGALAHQIYVGTDNEWWPDAVFRMENCYVHDGLGGNNIKSRAGRTELYGNWIEGAKYYELDLIGADPNGQQPGFNVREDADIVGNVIVRRATSAAVPAMRVGSDSLGDAWGRYRFAHNTFVFDRNIPGTPGALIVAAQTQSLEMHRNVFERFGKPLKLITTSLATIPNTGTDNWVSPGIVGLPASWTGTLSAGDAGFSDLLAENFTPTATSALTDAATGSMDSPVGFTFPNPRLVPTNHPTVRGAAPTARPVSGPPDIGAFELARTTSANGSPVAAPDVFIINSNLAAEHHALANDTDPDGDTLALVSVVPARWGTLAIRNQRLLYTPRSDFPGEEIITYHITDGATRVTGSATIRNPFLARSGNYDAAFAFPGHADQWAGSVRVKTTATGQFTATLRWATFRATLRGNLDGTGHGVATLTRADGTVVTLTLDLALNGAPELAAQIAVGPLTASASASRVAFSSKNPAPHLGRYTALLPTTDPDPSGQGWALLKVDAAGYATFAGKVQGGLAFATSGYVRDDATLPLYAPIAGKTSGALLGTLAFSPQAGSDATGTFDWLRPALAAPGPATLAAAAARWTPGGWTWTTASATFSSAEYPLPVIKTLAHNSGLITVTNPAADALVLSYSALTGAVRGSVRRPSSLTATSPLSGVVFLPTQRAAGIVASGEGAGRWEVTP